MCVCMHLSVCAHLRLCVRMHLCACLRAHVCVCMRVQRCLRACGHMCTGLSVPESRLYGTIMATSPLLM